MINFQSKKYLPDQQVRKLPYKPKYCDIPFEQVPIEVIVILMENASQLIPFNGIGRISIRAFLTILYPICLVII
jgi:hypothetical protein